jgi:hypothetical protein
MTSHSCISTVFAGVGLQKCELRNGTSTKGPKVQDPNIPVRLYLHLSSPVLRRVFASNADQNSLYIPYHARLVTKPLIRHLGPNDT